LLADKRDSSVGLYADPHNGSMSDELSNQLAADVMDEGQQEDPNEQRMVSLQKQLDIEMKVG